MTTGTGDVEPSQVMLVTGMSGAGKSSALKMLEDLGWEVVDNVPQSMLGMLITLEESDESRPPLAIGINSRTRGFDPAELIEHLDRFRDRIGHAATLCFFDADGEVLQRRFTETRRRHPLADDRSVMDGIRHERQLLSRLRDRASQLIDTSDVSLPELRELLKTRFSPSRPPGLQVFVTSFSFKRGLPREADLVFDVRFLRNPYYEADLREMSGADLPVQDFIQTDPAWPEFRERIEGLLGFLTPRYGREGKSYLTVAFGCTGGRHRSVFSAELFGERLRAEGHHVTVRHRDLRQ
ncbi:MAG: RNase adapter RapZ [Minwuia sp.]|uniref:RNase adapter RapZ n=1 Tax=Minwuia sp. TaxID=2493630 RepID=UPI003A848EEF